MWNLPHIQQIGTSTSTRNDDLITYPSITVCKSRQDLVFVDGGETPTLPTSHDLSEFLRMVRVTRPADHDNATEYNTFKGFFILGPTIILGMSPGLFVRK